MKATPAYQALLKKLNDQGYHDFFGVHRELKYLAKTLSPDEPLLAAVRGYVKAQTVLCTLTTRRIIFLNLGMVYRVQSSDVPLKMVNGISHRSGMLVCDLVVTNGADNIVVNDVLIKDANRFINAVTKALQDYEQGMRPQSQGYLSVADELIKYKELLDQQVITQAQFDDLKTKLLSNNRLDI